LEQELEGEYAEKQRKIGQYARALGMTQDPETEAEAMLDFLKGYGPAKEAWQRIKSGLDLLLDETDEKALQDERERVMFDGGSLKQQYALFEDFAPTAGEVAAWEKEESELNGVIEREAREQHELAGRLKGMERTQHDFTAQEAETEYLTREIAALEQRHEAILIAIDTVESIARDYRSDYLPVLEERSAAYLRDMTEGRYPSIKLKDNWPALALPTTDGVDALPGQLSTGTLDQLYLSLRLAACDLMSQHDMLPLVLDDPFVNFDDGRYREALSVLTEVARDRQILYFTAHTWVADALRAGGGAVNLIELTR
jgi:uncharacterized protein YhaN